jgi:hypothetical protein
VREDEVAGVDAADGERAAVDASGVGEEVEHTAILPVDEKTRSWRTSVADM